jgi:RNA polymerase sigma factor (sigma-70 family)
MAAVEGAAHAGATTQDLYSQYGKQIYSYCLHKLRSREEAEDAVQTTFMNAFRSLQRGATTQFEQAWLFKIAQNVCFARQTSSSRRRRLEAPNDFEVLQEIVPSRGGEQPLELMGLEEALEQMPENQRRAILLREWQGLSYREIAEELELTQAAVEMLIFRARRTLAGALEEPEEAEGRRVRAGRRVGVLGSLLGALKTLFGGGAAIKAVSIAAAAIAVVGESAHHTIVHQSAASSAVRVSPASALASASAASPMHGTARLASAAVGATAVPAPVAVHQHTAARVPHGHTVVSHAGGSTRPRTDEPLVTVSAPPTVAEAPPAPAPTAAPAPTQAPPVHEDPPKQQDAPKKEDRQPTIVSPQVATPPAETASTPPPIAATESGPGDNANGHDKVDHGNGHADPPPSTPTTSVPAVPAAAAVPAAPPGPPAAGDEGNGRGNANGRGHSK